MKSFIVAFALIAAVSAAEVGVRSLEQVVMAQGECIKKLEVPADIVSQLKQFQYPEEPIVADYLVCVAESLDMWDAKTGFVVEHVAQHYKGTFDIEEAKAIFTKCRDDNKTGDDAKLWVVAFQRCIAASKIGEKTRERFAPKA